MYEETQNLLCKESTSDYFIDLNELNVNVRINSDVHEGVLTLACLRLTANNDCLTYLPNF